MAHKKKIKTKNGQPMAFVQIEDFSPKPMEVVVFARVLEKTAHVWEPNAVIVLEGKLSFRDGETKLIAEKAQILEMTAAEQKARVASKVSSG